MLKDIFLKIKERLKVRKMSGVEYARYRGVKVGEDCRVYSRKLGSEPWLIKIGNKVTVAPEVQFITHDGSTWLFIDDRGRRQLFRRIDIADNIFIGMKSIILPGVKIEKDVVVAAGSVVTKSIPSGVIVGGNPAKIIGDFYAYEKKVLETYIANSEIDFSKDYKQRTIESLDPSFKEYLRK
ncbi:acyltransferase [Pareuzebyella sediminis]|uniref:acyltransferase n=1 Tax=Pareuzebyella sediminis TaxID=2607998 RepID=UPI001E2EE71B|nr:acyltransferase [Pareuzebyella sediminis]